MESSSGLDSSSGEGDMELSYSSSSFSGGEGSEPEGVHPFLHEPPGSSSGSDSEGSEDVSPRLLNLNW